MKGLRWKGKGAVRAWIPTGLLIALILFLSFHALPPLPRIRFFDTYLHIAVYCVLAILSHRSLVRSGMHRPSLTAFLIAIAVGIADEGIQSQGTVRVAEGRDLLADVGGALIAVIALRLLRRRRSSGAPVDGRDSVDNSGAR